MKSMTLGAALLLAFSISACAHKEPAPDEPKKEKAAASTAPSIEAQQVAAEEEAPYVAELKFAKKKAQLSAFNGDQIKKMIEKAQAHGQVSEIEIISWADEEYPSVHTKKLSDKQIKLADHRNTQIKDYVHNLDGKVEVKTYNMAERPNVLAEMVSSSNARVKKALEVAGIPNTDSSVKRPSKASRSIVLAVMKEK